LRLPVPCQVRMTRGNVKFLFVSLPVTLLISEVCENDFVRKAREILNVFTARCYASAVLAMALCPSVSVTSRCSIETAERIELVLACELPSTFHPSYTVLKGNSVISKNKGTSLWNFVLNSELRRKFRHGISIVETCYQLSSRKKDAQSVINWAVVGQLSR